MKNLLFSLLLILLSSCIYEDIEFPFRGDGTQINIFLVKEGKMDYSSTEIDLESLELEKNPWLKHSEIKFYDWSSHIFYLNVDKEKEKHSGKYFVLKSDEKRLFPGLFFPVYVSSIPRVPSIIAHDDFFYPLDVIGLGGYDFFYGNTIPLNKNREFRIALENSGLLKEGIVVDLTNIKRENTSTIKYTFKVTNLDTENIYIIDPEKMGAPRFHYHTNGVYFRQNTNYFSAQNIDNIPSENIDSRWYYKLAPGKSISRTVKQGGYTDLPSGKVIATFSFPGAKVQKGEWQKNDGRIWIGNFRVEKELELN